MTSVSTGDAVFVVLIEDRHTEPEPMVFSDEAAAVETARREAQQGARRPEDFEEVELNDAMTANGWRYYATYSCESDSVRVVRRELR